MHEPLGLRPLLAALRNAKIRVGPHEVLRLRQVFLVEPRLLDERLSQDGTLTDAEREERQRERLRAILAAVLVKRLEDRKAFDDCFDTWYRLAQDRQQTARGKGESHVTHPAPWRATAQTTRRGRRFTPKTLWLLAAVVIVGLVILIGPLVQEPTGPVIGPDPEKPIVDPGPARRSPDKPATHRTLHPEIRVEPVRPRWTGWAALLLGLFGLGVAGTLWHRLHGRTWLPDRALGAPQQGGPPQAFLRAPGPDSVILLDKPQEERLVWGIERFTTDEPTRRLDLPATVRTIARQGGLPALRFQHATRHREVWLWTDTATRDTHAERLAGEVARILDAYGLQCEQAEFRGIPDHLCLPDGQTFGPREVDERRETALVAILTDGRLLTRRYHADPARRVRIDALLRLLSHWPHLAWVDFGGGVSGLAEILGPHGLTLIAPEQLAAHIGGGTPARSGAPLGRDDQLWAAACALPPAPVEAADALALLRRLDLDTSPWALTALRAAAPGPGGRLQWEPQQRAKLLAWLAGLESPATPADGTAPGGLLDRALAFWETRYDQALAQTGTPASDTPADRRQRAERALLWLWRRPGEAIAELHDLAQGSVGDFIRSQLVGLTTADARRSPASTERPCVPMPWRWVARSPGERLMLQALGFGCAALAREQPRQPGRFWLGLGLCAGLAVGALLATLGKPSVEAVGAPRIEHEGTKPVDARAWPAPQEDGRWRVTITGKDCLAEQTDVPEASRVRVLWTSHERPCALDLDGDGELRYCGTLAEPVRLPDSEQPIHRRLAVLAADPDAPGIDALASALLDGGSADQVLIDPNWPQQRRLLTGAMRSLHPDDQLLLLTPEQTAADPAQRKAYAELIRSDPDQPPSAPRLWLAGDDWAPLAAALNAFDAGQSRSAADAWEDLTTLVDGEGQPLLLGGVGGCRPWEWTDETNGITWVELCGGTFTMGSPAPEPGRDNDERQHQVALSPFAIARTETTNAQYQKVHTDHPAKDDLPVGRVDWQQARDFCRAVGGDLPTEAQWEYAARAGTTTTWSFGDDEARLDEHAWYSMNADNKAHPVAQKQPNPWGLYDMHGNLWEWVADWYGAYPKVTEPDPTGPENGVVRVLRGGSFRSRAEDTRSAYRNRNLPEFRNDGDGLRCARAPRRQP